MPIQIALLWVGLSFIIAIFGMHRKFGFWGYFFASLLLSPPIGFLLLLASDPKRYAE